LSEARTLPNQLFIYPHRCDGQSLRLARMPHVKNKPNCPLCAAGVPLKIMLPVFDRDRHKEFLLAVSEKQYGEFLYCRNLFPKNVPPPFLGENI
jgi:hypothetical protein